MICILAVGTPPSSTARQPASVPLFLPAPSCTPDWASGGRTTLLESQPANLSTEPPPNASTVPRETLEAVIEGLDAVNHDACINRHSTEEALSAPPDLTVSGGGSASPCGGDPRDGGQKRGRGAPWSRLVGALVLECLLALLCFQLRSGGSSASKVGPNKVEGQKRSKNAEKDEVLTPAGGSTPLIYLIAVLVLCGVAFEASTMKYNAIKPAAEINARGRGTVPATLSVSTVP
ncbi:hypothetical protein EMIHUDRAFT_255172, partial [Emiliania huxleyi CCMP1516]|uniref:Uncharacterized protein n=2 Tax=Emiliania huxleyi TaxID=2903 RepID=A0A0D3JEK1_EMIH1